MFPLFGILLQLTLGDRLVGSGGTFAMLRHVVVNGGVSVSVEERHAGSRKKTARRFGGFGARAGKPKKEGHDVKKQGDYNFLF